MWTAKKIKTGLMGLLVISAIACKKKTQTNNSVVPYTPINVTIYPNDPQYFKIQTPGGWVYYNSAGANGLIIYRKNANEFIVLDRTSTALPDDPNAKAKVQSDNFTCKDTVSGSKWQIFDGTVISGPATYPLKAYYNNYDGNSLKISN